MTIELPSLPNIPGSPRWVEVAQARERILLARIAELEAQRDFLVDEYERAVKCGKQGYLHCAMHLFNAIANARIDAIIAARKKKE